MAVSGWSKDDGDRGAERVRMTIAVELRCRERSEREEETFWAMVRSCRFEMQRYEW